MELDKRMIFAFTKSVKLHKKPYEHRPTIILKNLLFLTNANSKNIIEVFNKPLMFSF